MKGNVIIAGATGLVGRRLSEALLQKGYGVIVLTRDTTKAKGLVPGALEYLTWETSGQSYWGRWFEGATAIVNLAGESLFRGRLTRLKYEASMASRIEAVRRLTTAILAAPVKPKAFLVGSSVGIYGFQGTTDEAVTELTVEGSDEHAQSNARWEQAAARASLAGVRTAYLRTGVVWDSSRGMIPSQVKQLKRGYGSIPGRGLGWLPWIHIDDEVGIILRLIEDDRLAGPYNLSAPNPVRYGEYIRYLAEVTGTPSPKQGSDFFAKLTLGKAADMVLHNRNMVPSRILEAGYKFQHVDAKSSLACLVKENDSKGVFNERNERDL